MKWTAVKYWSNRCWCQWSDCIRSYQKTTVSSARNVFLIILPSSDNIILSSFIGNSWTVDQGFRANAMIRLSRVLDINNIKRARYTLQITLCALFIKLGEAVFICEADLSSYDWLTQKLKNNTSFLYWKCIIDLQIKVLLFVCSICEGNFKLQVEVLYRLLSWYFIYDHYKYAHLLTIHWFDLYTIETKFSDIYNFLLKGNFSFQKSYRKFSVVDLNQIYEQNNKLIKGCGGASDLLNKVSDSALVYWETFSPEFICITAAFEDCLDRNVILAESSTNHNEDSQPFRKRFFSDVNRLIKCITVNPFMLDHFTKLKSMVDDLKATGEKQLETFASDRLVMSKVPISQKSTLNKMKIWNSSYTGQLKCNFKLWRTVWPWN